jgi:hypothetical protein
VQRTVPVRKTLSNQYFSEKQRMTDEDGNQVPQTYNLFTIIGRFQGCLERMDLKLDG